MIATWLLLAMSVFLIQLDIPKAVFDPSQPSGPFSRELAVTVESRSKCFSPNDPLIGADDLISGVTSL